MNVQQETVTAVMDVSIPKEVIIARDVMVTDYTPEGGA